MWRNLGVSLGMSLQYDTVVAIKIVMFHKVYFWYYLYGKYYSIVILY